MSTERSAELHQLASEHYLQGDYAKAIAAWRELLSIDPAHEEALEGVRMSTLLSEGEGVAAVPDDEIDVGLKVFDAIPKPAPPSSAPSPNETLILDRAAVEGMLREGAKGSGDAPAQAPEIPGFDFGDLAGVGAIPLSSSPVELPSAEQTDAPLGAFDDEGEAVGLAPMTEERVKPPVVSSAAAAELVKRVQDLLTEAKGKADAGDRQEARAILARVFILDEENAEARQLEAQLEIASGTSLADIETHLIEGVQAFDQGRHEEAKVHFRAVLDTHPEHREALHYLEKIQEQEASFGDMPEDLLAPQIAGEGGPVDEPLHPEPALSPEPVRPKRTPRAEMPSVAAAPVVPPSPKRSFSVPPKLVAVAVVAIALVGAGVWLVPKLLSSGGGSAEPVAPVAAAPRPTPPKPVTPPVATTPAPAPAPAMTLDQAMGKGRAALDAGDWGAAVIAFKAALDLDKANLEALDGIRRAGDAYKSEKAEQEQFDRVAMAFKEGEYASGLRLLYRMPDTVDRGRVERCKTDGWFNLGVVALRAGDVSAAIGHFEDALAIRPDSDATKWRAFAQRYRDLPKDRSFYDAVEAIPFRQIQ